MSSEAVVVVHTPPCTIEEDLIYERSRGTLRVIVVWKAQFFTKPVTASTKQKSAPNLRSRRQGRTTRRISGSAGTTGQRKKAPRPCGLGVLGSGLRGLGFRGLGYGFQLRGSSPNPTNRRVLWVLGPLANESMVRACRSGSFLRALGVREFSST